MSIAVTKRQMQLCRFVRDYQARHGYAPTFKEMAQGLGITAPSAHALVAGCIERGAMRRVPYGLARSIVVSSDMFIPDATDEAPATEGSRHGVTSGIG